MFYPIKYFKLILKVSEILKVHAIITGFARVSLIITKKSELSGWKNFITTRKYVITAWDHIV